MGAAENAKTVQALYEAFLADDMDSIFAFSEGLVWENFEANPFRGSHEGREGFTEMLEIIDQTDMTGFEVEQILADGNTVVAILNIDYTVKATGKAASSGPTVHIFEFDGDKAVRVREVAAADGGAWDA